jgi:hypothetical protein
MTRIVTTAYRSKRPPKKRKAVALAGPAIVAKRSPAAKSVEAPDRLPPASDEPKPAIVTTTSRKRAKLHAERPAEPDDPEAAAAMRAGIERAKWGHGPA